MMRVSTTSATTATLTRQEVLAAVGETAGLFLIFIVAFTGRGQFGDEVKFALVLLTLVVGGTGIAMGVVIGRRGLRFPIGRVIRLALATYMVFIGAYSIIHVLQ
jgi:hypothetical protein